MRALLLDTSARGRLLWAEVVSEAPGPWRTLQVAIEGPVAGVSGDALVARRLATLALDGFDVVVVTLGPGSYTGVRAGIAAALGVAAARGLPLHGCGALELVAAGAPDGVAAVCAAVEAGRGGLHWARMDIDPATRLPRPGAALLRATAEGLVAPAEAPLLLLAGVDLERAAAGAVTLALGRPPLDPARLEPLTGC